MSLLSNPDVLWVKVGDGLILERRPEPLPIPQGSMRVGPNTDAIVWRTCPTHTGRPE